MKELLRRYFRCDERESRAAFVALLLSVGCSLSAAALLGISLVVGVGPLWHAFRDADWLFLIFVPAAVAISHIGYALAYWEVARSEGYVDIRFAEAFHIVSTGFEPLSPRTSYALDVWELTKRGLSRDVAEHRVRVLGLLEYAVLAPATFIAAVYMAVAGLKAQSGLLPSWVIGVPAGTAIAVALLVAYRRRGRPHHWWAPIRRQLDAIDDLVRMVRSWRETPLALLGMLVYWTAEIAALIGCVNVFGDKRGAIAVMIVGYATGYALMRRALPLAGAGVVEALMPFALTWVGFPLASSVLAVIAYRIFNMWLPIIPAVISLRRLERVAPAVA